ncbi:MAG: M1 family metallopeptidase [Planctomycetota bacterium]|jgi:hypothetical protein
MLRLSLITAACGLLAGPALAQEGAAGAKQPTAKNGDVLFRQLEDELATPTAVRAASGAPGHRYWQQQVDYVIDATLDEAGHTITGRERVTYTNNSPDALRYLWVQLCQNMYAKDAEARHIRTTGPAGPETERGLRELGWELHRDAFPGGYTITKVLDRSGGPLAHTIHGTMMRIDLPAPLQPAQSVIFSIEWNFTVKEITHYSTRTGYELLEDDPKNPVYTMAHWYPRMAAYSDRYGWHVHHYLGEEFALEFGDFIINLTVPADYVVACTGELQNGAAVLSAAEQERLAQARTAPKPVFIVTPEEAKAREQGRATEAKTWSFAAKRVRDVAWAASRKYVWDAMGVEVDGRTVMAMSAYPNFSAPLWTPYSTHAVAQTLTYYSTHAYPYPYPVAWSCNGAVGGMEHPMVSFQSARPEKDGTYSPRQKYGLISVIIHEVGHNWFPMFINNDERRWRWMDEGFNSFVQQIAEGYWEKDYPSRNDKRRARILDYMAKSTDQPIMTNTSLVLEGGNNAYSKVTLAMTVLRETVLGRERFDFAFREYCRRWAFKRPMPADFFRTMEDAAGVDLDWYFRAWWFTADHVDLAVTGVRKLELQSRNPDVDKPAAKAREAAEVRRPRQERNDAQPKRVDAHPELRDFYNDEHDEHAVTEADRDKYRKFWKGLKPHERAVFESKRHIYVVDFANFGGIPMPLLLELHYTDGTRERRRIEATIWRRSVGGRIAKLLLLEKPLARIVLDPQREMADVDYADNSYPQAIQTGTLKLTGVGDGKSKNPMQKKRDAAKKAAEQAAKKAAGKKDGEDAGKDGGKQDGK